MQGIKPSDSSFKIKAAGVDLLVFKAESGDYWPRLHTEERNNKVKPDFDRMTEQEEEDELEQRASLEQMKAELDSAQKEEQRTEDDMADMATKAYRMLFHFVSTLGWILTLGSLGVASVSGTQIWLSAGPWVTICHMCGYGRGFAL